MAKINPIAFLVNYVKEAKAEMKKVTWPTKKEVKQHTIFVIAFSLVIALFLGLVDYALTFGLEKIIK